MNIDLAKELGAVTREVRDGKRDGKPTRTVIAGRTYDTTLDDAWDALTSAERIPRWMAPVTGDLRLGGRYQIEGNAGGEITICDPPRHLALTWEFGGGMSWVEVRLAASAAGGVYLELQHEAPVDEHWAKYGPGAVGVGWELTLLGFALHMNGDHAAPPEQRIEWSISQNGKDFVTGSGLAWGEAAIASGDEEAVARESAARTIAFYRGEA